MTLNETPVELKFSDYKRVQRLLSEDFDQDEIKPYIAMVHYLLRGEYSGYALYDGGDIAAYAVFFDDKANGNCLLDYLAVRKNWRGGGVGGRFLARLCKLKPDMVLEAEDPDFARDEADKAMRERRLSFYRRCGFIPSGVRSCLFGVNYVILERCDARAHSTLSSVTGLYKSMFGKVGRERYTKVF